MTKYRYNKKQRMIFKPLIIMGYFLTLYLAAYVFPNLSPKEISLIPFAIFIGILLFFLFGMLFVMVNEKVEVTNMKRIIRRRKDRHYDLAKKLGFEKEERSGVYIYIISEQTIIALSETTGIGLCFMLLFINDEGQPYIKIPLSSLEIEGFIDKLENPNAGGELIDVSLFKMGYDVRSYQTAHKGEDYEHNS